MGATIVGDGIGPRKWSLVRDEKWHRDYTVVYRVEVDSLLEGPAVALTAPNLPFPGAQYIIDNERDYWAYCYPNVQVNPVLDVPDKFYDLTFLFSTRPLDACSDESIENPILRPQKISGGTIRYTEEMMYDRFGNQIRNSAWENITGPQVEFDAARSTVRVEQNVPELEYELVTSMLNTVNDATLWGMTARKIKFSDWTWERKFHGNCIKYYTRVLNFETNKDTFDRTIVDRGRKVLNGHWSDRTGNWVLDNIETTVFGFTTYSPPNKSDPSHFIEYRDRQNNPSTVVLNGYGVPAQITLGTGTGTETSGPPGSIFIAYYSESNFLLLRIPTEF